MSVIDFTKLGAVKVTPMNSDPNDPNPDTHFWNFGLAGRPGLAGPSPVAGSAPFLYDIAPHVQGVYDWKRPICFPEIERKVLGKPLRAQYQTLGTCGGHAGSRAAETLQVLMIAAGGNGTFKEVSHAWLYFIARREFGMLGGGDGVADGSIPPVMAKYGVLNREEANDPESYGPNVDKVAGVWGSRRGAPENIHQLGLDNLVKHSAKIRSYQELADGMAVGGVPVISDASGFSMSRDNYGFCTRRGTWYHYHGCGGCGVAGNGRKYFAYVQSWDENVPSGPLLMDGAYPSHQFGIDIDAMDEMCREGSVHLLFSFDLWDPKQKLDIDWGKYF